MFPVEHSGPMISRRDVLLSVCGLGILGSAGLTDVWLTRGLSDPAGLAFAVSRLRELPEHIGSWTSTAVEIDARELQLGEIAGYFRREYRHAETGRAATLTILCGASGPLCVHPPTACFEGVGYTLNSGPTLISLTDHHGIAAGFNRASFRTRNTTVGEQVRVFWAWGTDGNWDAPANPRLSYRGYPVLFKLYAVDRAWESADELAQSESLLKDALPMIRGVLRNA